MIVEVTVWVCQRCGAYYGSSSAGNLHTNWNRDEKNKRTFQRSRCPNHQDEPMLRQPHTFNVEITGLADESESDHQ